METKRSTAEISPPGNRPPAARRKGRPVLGSSTGVGRQGLITAACELLQTLPPDKITRAEVARRANVAPALIRYHFKDNHSLLRATAGSLAGHFQEQAAAAIDHSATPVEQLRLRIETFLRFQIAYPFFHRLMTEELIGSDDDDARPLLHEVSVRGAEAYRQIVQEGVDQGMMRIVDPALLYLAIIGFAELVSTGRGILRELAHPAAESDDYAERCSRFIVDLLVNGLRSQ